MANHPLPYGERENLGRWAKQDAPKFTMPGTSVQVAGFTRPLIHTDETPPHEDKEDFHD